ncbi:hypothetical protein HZH66_012998 [Vespula vulgaris]|uniref:Uncharacterized protein n=1 Tax=Vespula vulgaris TaxID=7454 RepID=A0A834J8I4_VESVU|nr:hypothetical protein HZH66_012998 [Vespula vulgaris]
MFNKNRQLPPKISSKLDDYWRAYKAQFNKTYSGNLDNTRRIKWEQNLVKIYEHNLMAAAGHHGYTLRDNHIADLSTKHQGVYDDVACTSDIVNHAILIVGYTPNEWILKNWWGEHWGEGGYMRLARHKNRCGIANYAAYAKIE